MDPTNNSKWWPGPHIENLSRSLFSSVPITHVTLLDHYFIIMNLTSLSENKRLKKTKQKQCISSLKIITHTNNTTMKSMIRWILWKGCVRCKAKIKETIWSEKGPTKVKSQNLIQIHLAAYPQERMRMGSALFRIKIGLVCISLHVARNTL